VVDTGNLVVNGQPVKLAGISGEGGIYAAQLQTMINSQGAQVQCTLQGSAYVCTLGNGLDIARTALWNGGADLASDASDDYRAQADAARAAHKGIWR
jgi:endonuclease YncB( thermonuclease family)